jgi:hypothetical protein
MTICILLGRWATDEQIALLNKILLRLSETTKVTNGLAFWNHLRWDPLSLLTYAAGISALSAGNYKVMRSVLLQQVFVERDNGPAQIVVQAGSNMAEADDGFKHLPGQDRKRVPRSEYMFELLRPPLDDLLFLGEGYESYFDEFEILSALTYADITASNRGGRLWGPVGRFGWNAMSKYVERALAEGATWPMLNAGLFSSKQERFKEVAKGYLEFLLPLVAIELRGRRADAFRIDRFSMSHCDEIEGALS